MERPADYEHLMCHAQDLFPGAVIDVIHTLDEIIISVWTDIATHSRLAAMTTNISSVTEGPRSAFHFFLIRPGIDPDGPRPPVLSIHRSQRKE